jgi:hypothetical protein
MNSSENKNTSSGATKFLFVIVILLVAGSLTGVLDYRIPYVNDARSIDYSEDAPEVYIGTDYGSIYHLSPGQRPQKVGSVRNKVQSINFHDKAAFVAYSRDTTKSEESSSSESYIKIFNGSKTETVDIDNSLNDIHVSRNKLVVANPGMHSHGDTSNHSHSEDISQGSLDIFGLENKSLTNQVAVRSPYRFNPYDRGILVTGEEGDVALYNMKTENVERTIDTGMWTGDAVYNDSNVIVASRKYEELNLNSGKEVNVKHGFITSYNLEKNDSVGLDLGVSSVPHDVRLYNSSSLIATDSADEEVLFIDWNKRRTVETVNITDEITGMIVSGGFAYVAGAEEDAIYEISLENKSLSRKIEVPGINTIAKAPEEEINWG